MEIPLPHRRNPHLRTGVWLSVLYLERENTKDLASERVRHARRDCSYDGNVSFFACDDRP